MTRQRGATSEVDRAPRPHSDATQSLWPLPDRPAESGPTRRRDGTSLKCSRPRPGPSRLHVVPGRRRRSPVTDGRDRTLRVHFGRRRVELSMGGSDETNRRTPAVMHMLIPTRLPGSVRLGRVSMYNSNFFLCDRRFFCRQHSKMFHNLAPPVRICLFGPVSFSDGGGRKLAGADK